MRILIAEDEIATAKASDKRLDTDIAEEVFITGDKAAIQQMLSVLLDKRCGIRMITAR
ncbi:MAG: hypothetical protein IJT24_00990 [Lachnospiraceae bacterium]|nr:hypothetical protein [Lachnospiraceae bacterium]